MKYKNIFCLSWRIAAAFGAGALLAACSNQNAAAPASQAPEVAVITAAAEPAAITHTLPARATAYQTAEIRPQVSGVIKQRLFTEGQFVEAGAPLYQIDPAPYEAAYQSAVANLARAEAAAQAAANREKRYAELVKVNGVSRQDYDDAAASAGQARADVLAARAARDAAKIDLDRTKISAPISGHIGRTLVTDGALVTANQASALAVVTTLDPIYVDMTQSSAAMLRWKHRVETQNVSLPVTLQLEDGTAYDQKGELQATEVTVNPSTSTVTMRAVFANPDHLLLPGMFVRATVAEGVEEAILAPQKAVSRNAKGEGVVYVVNDEGKAEQKIVKADRAYGDKWIVTDGLAVGDRLIVEGFQKFRPGEAVTAVPESERIAQTGTGKSGDVK